MGSSVKIPKGLLNIDKTILNAVKMGVEDCTDDLLRVATLRSPRDEKNLEKSGDSKVDVKPNKIVGQVSFQAMNKGFNYALKMDRGKYKLGEKSKPKTIQQIRSKFTKESLPVGSGYLSDTADKCQEGYTDHVNYMIYEVIAKDGFDVLKKK